MASKAEISLSLLTIAAIILGPVLALYVQSVLNRRKERKDRKLQIFRTLMATRATRLSPLYVEALNAIEVEFYGNRKEEKKVIEAWREYCDHLLLPAKIKPEEIKRWDEKSVDLLVNLLDAMADSLGYHFDKVTLKKNTYYPRGFGEIEEEIMQLRKAMLQVFSGKRPLLMALSEAIKIAGESAGPSDTENSKGG